MTPLRLPHSVTLLVVFSLVALVAVGPHFIFGYPDGDGAPTNVPWFESFRQQLLAGDLYPRWLVDYPDGLGAPVFYFYAPAPFYLTAAIGTVLCPGCDAVDMLSVGHWAIFALSGLTFYAWIRSLTDRLTGMIAGIAYVVLPYHFLDLEVRNAIGESMAYVWTPLILLGLRSMARSNGSVVVAAAAYAGLILSHLPSALLMTPVMIVFTAALARRRTVVPLALKLSLVGLIGIGLAAVYLVPALALRDTLPADAWIAASGPHYFPETWLLFHETDMPDFCAIVYASLAYSTFLALAGLTALLALGEGAHREPADHRPIVLAAAVSIALSWLMMTGLAEPIWLHVSALRQVQFPWRLGTVVDVCAATIVAFAVWRLGLVFKSGGGMARLWTGHGLPAASLLFVAVPMALLMWEFRGNFTREEWTTPSTASDDFPIEYRPKWVVGSTWYRESYEHWSARVALLPEIRILSGAERGDSVSVARLDNATFEITAALSNLETVGLRRIYFPHWRLTDLLSGATIPLRPAADTGLVEFNLAPGRKRLLLDTVDVGIEHWGSTISVVSLVLFLALIAVERRAELGQARRTIVRLWRSSRSPRGGAGPIDG